MYLEWAEAPKTREREVLRDIILRVSCWVATKSLCGILGYPGKCLILFFGNADFTCVISVLWFTLLGPDFVMPLRSA